MNLHTILTSFSISPLTLSSLLQPSLTSYSRSSLILSLYPYFSVAFFFPSLYYQSPISPSLFSSHSCLLPTFESLRPLHFNCILLSTLSRVFLLFPYLCITSPSRLPSPFLLPTPSFLPPLPHRHCPHSSLTASFPPSQCPPSFLPFYFIVSFL